MNTDKKMRIIYAITERNGRSFWNRIGVVFVNKDGSENALFDCFPTDHPRIGIQIRDRAVKEDGTEQQEGHAHA